MSCASQENCRKPDHWAAFIWIQKSAPRKIHFLTDFIRIHFCASLDDRFWKCHQSKTWRYQGATVHLKDLSMMNPNSRDITAFKWIPFRSFSWTFKERWSGYEFNWVTIESRKIRQFALTDVHARSSSLSATEDRNKKEILFKKHLGKRLRMRVKYRQMWHS